MYHSSALNLDFEVINLGVNTYSNITNYALFMFLPDGRKLKIHVNEDYYKAFGYIDYLEMLNAQNKLMRVPPLND